MPKYNIPIVITVSDFLACGCAYCGHDQGFPKTITQDMALQWQCQMPNCGGTTVVVADELDHSPYGFGHLGLTKPKVQAHPLKQPLQEGRTVSPT